MRLITTATVTILSFFIILNTAIDGHSTSQTVYDKNTENETRQGLSYEIEKEIDEQVSNALSNHFNVSGFLSVPEMFVRYLDKTYGEKGIKELKSYLRAGKGSKPVCIAFGAIIELGKRLLREEFEYSKVIELVCKVFKIQRGDICDGLAGSFGPHIHYIFTKSKINSLEQVALLLGIDSCFDVQRFQSSKLNWLIPLPPPKELSKVPPTKGSRHHNRKHQRNDVHYNDDANDVIDWTDVEATAAESIVDYNRQNDGTRIENEEESRRGRWTGNKIRDSSSGKRMKPRHGHHHSHRNTGHKRDRERKRKRRSIKFLQLTDVHLDLLYKQGSPINCGAPLCCRGNSSNLTTNSICSDNPQQSSFTTSECTDSNQGQAIHGSVSQEEQDGNKRDQRTGVESMKVKERSKIEEERSGPLQLMKSTLCTKTRTSRIAYEEGEEEEGAGEWGELEGFCDSPFQTGLSLLHHINELFSRHSIHGKDLGIKLEGVELNMKKGIQKGNLPVNDARKKSRHRRSQDHKVKGRDFENGNDHTNENVGLDDMSRSDMVNDNEYPSLNDITNGRKHHHDNDEDEEKMNALSGSSEDDARYSRGKHHEADNNTIDYILWTGDITPHDVWNSDMEDLIRVVRTWTQAMKTYLPAGVPVFPVMGNHDTVPVNQFVHPDVEGPLSMDWIYKLYGSNWKSWLGTNAMSTFSTRGYYSKLFPLDCKKSLKIIVINTNYCSRENFWQLYDPVDPGNQLKWLTDELLAAEKNQQIVHIVGHAPITSDACTQTWAHNYFAIINRFKNIIRTSFFGHTHRDELRLYYSKKQEGESLEEVNDTEKQEEEQEDENAILVGFVGGSITTFGYVNPCYKIYQMNHEGIILDQDTYFLNVTEANEKSLQDECYKPEWKYLYTATKEYKIKNLSTQEVVKVHKRMENYDDGMIEKYFKIMTRSSTSSIWNKCTKLCKKTFVDMIKVTDTLQDYFK